MNQNLYKAMVELTSNPIYTALLKSFSTSRLSKTFIRPFSQAYKIDEKEMADHIEDYASLNDFFIRKLKDDARPIDERRHVLTSPVDGLISEAGKIEANGRFFIKEKEYSLTQLLGLRSAIDRYIGGDYLLFYLSPKDYHRIHSPVTGHVVKRWALGKYSEPVNQLGLLLGDNPLATNYRLITELELANERVALVKVGALNVNSIQYSHLNNNLKKGEELAYFTFGSSIILLFEKDTIQLLGDIKDKHIKQGQPIARLMS